MRDGLSRRARALLAVLALLAGPTVAARAQGYAGPPDSSTAYWEEPAFADHPYKGAGKAVGALLWSHGLDGRNAQWHIAPPPIIRDFAKAGWDVIKVQRNSLHENGWSASGPRHIADLLQRVQAARSKGYVKVIVAGQSYGGAISLEAGHSELVSGVIAFAPGHGSDACGSGFGSVREISSNLPGYLAETIGRLRAPRVVLSMADGDECMGRQQPTARLEAALGATAAAYVHFDAGMPIRGHGAATTNQFSGWYRDCLLDFLAPDKAPAKGRTLCPPPANTRFLMPDNVAASSGPARPSTLAELAGAWSGTLNSPDTTLERDREICVAIAEIGSGGLKGTAYYGAGPARTVSMTNVKLNAARQGEAFIHRGQEQFAIALTPDLGTTTIDLAITSRNGKNRFTAKLKPGC